MTEEWVPVPRFPKYSVSNHGRVRNEKSGRILVVYANQSGVTCVGLMRDGVQNHRSLAKLVATQFVPTTYEAFDTPINLDGDRYNNHVDNLVWRPRWFSVKYNQQFRVPYEHRVHATIVDLGSEDVYPDSLTCAKANGLLEEDLVLSILNNTIVWPTHQKFMVLD